MAGNIDITLRSYSERYNARLLLRAAQAFVGLLHDLDVAISADTRGTIEWEIVTLQKASPARFGFVGKTRLLGGVDHSNEVGERCVRGIALLTDKAERDPFYSEAALRKAYSLARLRLDVFAQITVQTPRSEVSIEPAIAEHILDLTKEDDEEFGSVLGGLDSISVHRGNEFRVWDEVDGRAVLCRFPDALLDSAKESLKRRVLVFGTLRKNRIGQVGSIAVDGMESYPADEELPTIEEMSGSIPGITDGLSLRDYLKRLDED
jgi:hypothetical protein